MERQAEATLLKGKGGEEDSGGRRRRGKKNQTMSFLI